MVPYSGPPVLGRATALSRESTVVRGPAFYRNDDILVYDFLGRHRTSYDVDLVDVRDVDVSRPVVCSNTRHQMSADV